MEVRCEDSFFFSFCFENIRDGKELRMGGR